MASIRRHPRSKYFYACFIGADGRAVQRSTKATDRATALQIALQFEKAAKLGRRGRLIDTQARKVINEIFELSNDQTLPCSTVKDFLKQWLSNKSLEMGETSYRRYEHGCREFLNFLGNKAERDMVHVRSQDILEFRKQLAERVTVGSVNVTLKIVRAAFNEARRGGFIGSSPLDGVPLLKRSKFQRRPFTMTELTSVLAVATPEWRGMVLVGLYAGLRLGDIASLKWQHIDLTEGVITVRTQKTERQQVIPMAPALHEYFYSLTAGSSDEPVFPEMFKLHSGSAISGALSKSFHKVLVKAGLIDKRPQAPLGKGRKAKRNMNPLSFHSLRHTATSLLKNAGVSDAIARDIIGHDSEAVSRQYSHISLEAKRKAVNLLPRI